MKTYKKVIIAVLIISSVLAIYIRYQRKQLGKLDMQVESFSKDSLYISQNCSWKNADSQSVNPDLLVKELPKAAEVEIIKIVNDSIFKILTYATKTKNDTIHLFDPPDYGGNLIVGKNENGEIKSHQKSINNKKFRWLSNNSFRLGNDLYKLLTKTDMDAFKEITSKYFYAEESDSGSIILGGP